MPDAYPCPVCGGNRPWEASFSRDGSTCRHPDVSRVDETDIVRASETVQVGPKTDGPSPSHDATEGAE